MVPLLCTDPQNKTANTFYLEKEESEDYITYFVHKSQKISPKDEWFDATFTYVDENLIQSTMLSNNSKDCYRGKGITEALFQYVVNTTGKKLISSSNRKEKKNFDNEYRTPCASKVWDRLVKVGKACYDKGEDRYNYK